MTIPTTLREKYLNKRVHLYIKYPMADDLEMTLLSSGTRLTIDNKSYSVVSVSDEMGLATVQLQTRNGR